MAGLKTYEHLAENGIVEVTRAPRLSERPTIPGTDTRRNSLTIPTDIPTESLPDTQPSPLTDDRFLLPTTSAHASTQQAAAAHTSRQKPVNQIPVIDLETGTVDDDMELDGVVGDVSAENELEDQELPLPLRRSRRRQDVGQGKSALQKVPPVNPRKGYTSKASASSPKAMKKPAVKQPNKGKGSR